MKLLTLKLKLYILTTLAFVSVAGNGCASIFSPKTYPVQVSSNTPGAVCTVSKKNSGEVIFQGQTPCTVTLFPGDKDYIFKVNGDEQEVNHQQNPAVLANLILGPFGIFGMVIDLGTGNAWEYPKKPLYFN